MCTLPMRHAAAALLLFALAAVAVAKSPPSRSHWRDWLGFVAVPPRDDCFVQRRLSLDSGNALRVRAVYVCY